MDSPVKFLLTKISQQQLPSTSTDANLSSKLLETKESISSSISIKSPLKCVFSKRISLHAKYGVVVVVVVVEVVEAVVFGT